MPISLKCQCGRKFRVKDEAAGKKVRCPDCQKVLVVPDPEEFESNEVNDWEEDLPPRRASPGKSKGRKSNSKAKSGQVGKIILMLVVGSVAFLVSSYVSYHLVRGKKQVPPAQDVAQTHEGPPAGTVAAANLDPAKSVPPSPAPNKTTSTEYGVPVLEGLMLSPTLVHEMELIMKEMATQAGVQLPDDALQQGVRQGISGIREADAQLFCLTAEGEKLLAECGESTKSEYLSEYNSLYSQLENAKLESPQMVSVFHESVKSGKASCGRLKALSQIMASKLRKKPDGSQG